MAADEADSSRFVSVAIEFGATRKVRRTLTSNCLVREEPLLRIPFEWKTSVILQSLGRKAYGLSPRADRFNYRRGQESERDYVA